MKNKIANIAIMVLATIALILGIMLIHTENALAAARTNSEPVITECTEIVRVVYVVDGEVSFESDVNVDDVTETEDESMCEND